MAAWVTSMCFPRLLLHACMSVPAHAGSVVDFVCGQSHNFWEGTVITVLMPAGCVARGRTQHGTQPRRDHIRAGILLCKTLSLNACSADSYRRVACLCFYASAGRAGLLVSASSPAASVPARHSTCVSMGQHQPVSVCAHAGSCRLGANHG